MTLRPDPDEYLVVDVRDDACPSRSFLRISGDLDFATAAGLRRRFDTLMRDSVHHLVVDLCEVSFCDLAGLRVLLGVDRELRARGGDLTLLGPCPWVSRILAVLDLTDQLRIEPGASTAGRDGVGSRH
jgi:anti-anti-sigma factor